MEVEPQLPTRIAPWFPSFRFLDFQGVNFNTFVMSLVVCGILVLVAWLCTRRLRMVPCRGQAILEVVVEAFDRLVRQAIGPRLGRKMLPYIGTLFLFIWVSNMIGLVPLEIPPFSLGNLGYFPGLSFEEPTKDLNVPLGLGLLAFVVANVLEMRVKGLWGYLKEYFSPIFIMLPLNVVGKVAQLVSHSFRLFGNIFGGFVIFGLVSWLALSVVLPVGLSLFFGLFVGTVQAFVFAMLALTYAAVGVAED